MKVDVAEKQLAEIQSRIDAARATLALQEANLKQARQDLNRAQKLYEKGAFAEATLEKATTAYDVAKAQVDAAHEQVKQALASLETQKLVVQQTKSAYQSQGYIVQQGEIPAIRHLVNRPGITKCLKVSGLNGVQCDNRRTAHQVAQYDFAVHATAA